MMVNEKNLAVSERPKSLFTYKVRGRSEFPIDMMRHDRAVPKSQSDVGNVDLIGDRTIELVSYMHPTIARWHSFGWEVI